MTKRTHALVFGFGAVVLAACQVIAGIERVDKVQASGVGADGGPNGTSSSSGTIPVNDPCKHLLPPPPPDKTDPGEDLPQFYMATVELSLTRPAPNGIGGYDLDEVCTCDQRPDTAHLGHSSCTPRNGKPTCDGDGGVDNAGAVLFQTFQTLGQTNLDDSFNSGVAKGTRTIMIYINGWNGQKNDLDVQVSLFVSNGANGSDPPDLDGGTGDWSYPSTAHKRDGFIVPAAASNGYVANGTLVVSKAGVVNVLFGDTGLTFNDAIIIGELGRDATSGIAQFIGVVGGRIIDSELLSAAGQIKVAGTTPACEYTPSGIPLFATAIKPQICAATDIAHASLTDFKDVTCDAISSAISIRALSATVSGDAPKDPDLGSGPNPCSPGQPGVPADLYKCP